MLSAFGAACNACVVASLLYYLVSFNAVYCSGVLEAAAQAACDYFVYVQQALSDSERVDLQPAVTLSIVLHHYTAWAK
jgi:hypothetical protein